MKPELFTEHYEFLTDSEYIVCIDTGHGGIIDGNYETAPNKMYDHGDFAFYEGEFNRKIGVLLADKLKESKISYSFTTISNYDISLDVRVVRANNLHVLFPGKKHIDISIHSNAAPEGQESATGIEVYTSKGDTPADPMATIIFKHLETIGWKMRKDISDGDPDKESQFYFLRKTIAPAILVELGFYTNKEEALKLIKPEFQELFATKLFDAIVEIINLPRNV